MPKIEIELEKTNENNEIGEIMLHQQNFTQLSNELSRLIDARNTALMSLNRVVKSAIDRAKLGNEEIRDIPFPPFIMNDRVLYTIINGKLGITIPDKPVPNINNVVDLSEKQVEKIDG